MSEPLKCKIINLGSGHELKEDGITETAINAWLKDNPNIKIEIIKIVQTSSYISEAKMIILYK